jgi:hypothetical protein
MFDIGALGFSGQVSVRAPGRLPREWTSGATDNQELTTDNYPFNASAWSTSIVASTR